MKGDVLSLVQDSHQEKERRPVVSWDPVTFEILRSAFYSICEEMKNVIMRAAFSPLISLSSDLSCALADRHGNVIAQGNDIAVHLGAMPYSIRGALKVISSDELRPGDAILTNDVYNGGSHLPDMTLISPMFVDDELIGYAVNRTHWPDVGGSAPGSSSVTQEIYQEGIRIPPVLMFREGRLQPGTVGDCICKRKGTGRKEGRPPCPVCREHARPAEDPGPGEALRHRPCQAGHGGDLAVFENPH